LLLIAISVIAFPIFLLVERRANEPLMRLELFGVRNIMVANIAGLISGAGMFLMFTGLVYYLQLPQPYGLGLSIIESGLLMAPVALVMMIVGPIVGRLINATGPKPLLIIGSVISIFGYLLLDTFRYSVYEVVLDVMITAVGLVNIMIPLVNMVAVSLPEEQRGIGIGMNTLIRTIGSSIGPVISTVFMDTYTTWIIYDFNDQIVPLAQVPSYLAFHYYVYCCSQYNGPKPYRCLYSLGIT